jgi:hypothetical protein
LVNVNNLLDRLNDVNIVVLTDVHSWVAGHGRHEPYLNADSGDILSWYQHFQEAIIAAAAHNDDEAAAADKKDLFFVMDGDFVDGTGLSQVPPRRLVPILQHMPFSAINLGNHEIYHNKTIRFLQTSGFIRHWKGAYLTSNTVWADTGEPIGDRYTYWKCQQQQHKYQQQAASILVFGFLFNDQQFCKITRVETVQETIRQAWFQNVLHQGGFQAIVVMAHMGYLDPLVQVLRRAIRDIVGPDMVIQFINGHTHERGFKVLDGDPLASAFEAGRFLDTVGFISFPLLKNSTTTTSSRFTASFPQNASLLYQPTDGAISSSVFEPVFLDTNTKVLAQALGVENFVKTKDGKDLSRLIYNTRVSMGLTRVVGCSNTTYFLADDDDDNNNKAIDSSSSSSLWGLYMNKVIPSVLLEYNASKVFVQSTGAFKCNLWMGNITTDDLIETSPYDDPIYNVVNRISGTDLINVLHVLGASNTNPFLPSLPQIAVSSSLGMTTSSNSPTTAAGESSSRLLPDQFYDLYAGEWDTSFMAPVLANVTGRQNDTPVLYMQNEHDKPPRLWTTGRVWREYVARAWPCPITTRASPLVLPSTIRFSLWGLLVPLVLVPFLARVGYLFRLKRLSSLPRRTTLDSSCETQRLIDDNDDESAVRVTSRETYHST